jgi:3-hydroxyisobutyrate dehydrogenase-like beta-hydroxyacid dehydrogenase
MGTPSDIGMSHRVRTFQEDVDIVGSFARTLGCPTPLFTVAAELNQAALAQDHGDEDTASVFAVLRRLAGS